MKDILIRKATLHITLPIFCQKCGVEGRTEPRTVTIENTTLNGLAEVMSRQRISTSFPVGWAGYVNYHRCPNCIS